MKINFLIMSAFGPYAGEQRLDFGKIRDKRIFLVTGPTGAGKTSIFDAVAYALFGEGSGDGRSSDSFRSHFASLETETFVELSFEIRGTGFIVRRSPKQERPKLKGDGTTVKNAEALLTVPGSKPVVGVAEVDKKIQEILGLSPLQFRQIVMLPQGEFRKLLEASSGDREDIFRRIFKTEGFKLIQDSLKAKAAELNDEIGDTYNRINGAIEKLDADGTELTACIKARDKEHERIIGLAKSDIESRRLLASQMKASIADLENELINFASRIARGEEINKKIEARNYLLGQKINLSEQFPFIKRKEMELLKSRRAAVLNEMHNNLEKRKADVSKFSRLIDSDKLTLEKTNLEFFDLESNFKQAKDRYETVNGLEEHIRNLKIQIEKLKDYTTKLSSLENLNKRKTELNEAFKSQVLRLEENNRTLKKTEENIEKVNSLLPLVMSGELTLQNLRTVETALKDGYALVKETESLKKKHTELSMEYEHKNVYCKEQKQKYELKFEAFKNSQAGILASGLEDGRPCPVCGSLSHPHKAELCAGAPKEQELEKAKKAAEDAQAAREKAYNEVLSVYSSITEKEKTLKKYDEKYPVNQIELLIQDNTDKIRKETEELNGLKGQLEQKNGLLAVRDRLKTEADKIETEKETIETKISECNQEAAVLMSQIKQLEEGLPEDTRDQAALNKEISALKAEILKITDNYQNIEKTIAEIKNRQLVLATNIAANEKNLADVQKTVVLESEAFADRLKEFSFNNPDEYTRFLFSDTLTESLESEVRKYYEEVSHAEQTLSALNAELGALAKTDLEELKEQEAAVKAKRDVMNQEYTALEIKIQHNLGQLTEIETLYKKVKNKISEFEILSDLAKIAGGDNDERLTFERFVLAAYFDEIILSANSRLEDMTNCRYVLSRRSEKGKGRAQQGLDLEVIDNYTSRSRPVKTLSGGEAFIAALALALGLADVVQSYSGGIQLDTIFIDEGFGSLDPESLEHAIATLVKIQKTGRLVGIISHVEELKERIDVKLQITPTKEGSTAAFNL